MGRKGSAAEKPPPVAAAGSESWTREPEYRLRQVLDQTNSVIFWKDLAGRYLFVNQEFCALVGRPAQEILGRRDEEVLPPEAARRFRANDRRVLESRGPLAVEEQGEFGGRMRTFLVNKFPLLDPAGEPYALCGIATDITDRKRLEEGLRAAALAVSRAEGESTFMELANALATILEVELSFVAIFAPDRSKMRTLALHLDGRIVDNLDYTLVGTPCEEVVGREFQYFPNGLSSHFPRGEMFIALGIESYAAYPLNDANGEPLGLIAAVSRRPMRQRDFTESILKIFAARAAAEVARRDTEEQRRHSETSYRNIFEASADAISIHDYATGAIVDVNPAACRNYGYTRDEMLGLTVAALSSGEPPYTWEGAIPWILKAKQGERVQFEWHRRNKDGSLHWDEVVVCRAEISGRPRILAFTREITARKRAEEAVRASEAQYRAIFDASEDALVLWNAQMQRVDVNPAYERIYGATREEVLSGAYPPPMPIEYREERLGLVRRTLAGETCRAELESVRKDGRHVFVEVRTIPVRHRDEPHVLAIVRDVTERKQHEEQLRSSEGRLRATIEAALDAMIGMDANGNIVEFNAAAERCFGHRREAVLGRTLADVVIPERHRDRHKAGMAHYLATGRGPYLGRRIEVEGLRADGSEFPADLAIGVAQSRDGPIFIGFLRDITEQRRAEKLRAQLEGQLRQAQKMEAIGHLAGGIAHDFNNILTSINGYLALAEEREEELGDARLARYLEQARGGAGRARDLIRQMLTFSRGQKGTPRRLALPAVVEELSRFLAPMLPSSIDFSVVPCAGPAEVLADPVQLEQVVMNLCINARDALGGRGRIRIAVRPFSGRAVCASCRAEVSGPLVALEVSDDGPGITQDVLERMFEPFFSTKEVGQGSGMGLATVHGIVHELGGHVLVDSGPGQGTCFRVVLPGVEADLAPGADALPAVAARPRRRLVGRVLVVDDEQMVAGFLGELLEGWGLQVTTCADGLAARDLFAARPDAFDLVLSDQTMPRMTGLELAREIRRQRADLPVLLMSGFIDGLGEDVLREAGVWRLLEKPIDPARLFPLLAETLGALGS